LRRRGSAQRGRGTIVLGSSTALDITNRLRVQPSFGDYHLETDNISNTKVCRAARIGVRMAGRSEMTSDNSAELRKQHNFLYLPIRKFLLSFKRLLMNILRKVS
jgi:hypothetical protein